jgi:DNA-binding SARP family transcriptional activator
VDFRVLGPLDVTASGKEVSVGGPRQQNLLGALLLSATQVMPLSHLVDVIWQHDPPLSADKQVRNVASDLRGRLAGTSAVIVAVASGYRLDVPPDDLDSLVFARLVEQARDHAKHGRRPQSLAAFRSALNLWRGPALAGLGSPALQPRLARLNEERLIAFEEYVELALAHGQHRAVLSDLFEWVTANPLRERLAGQLMLALYRCERQADALAIYEQTRRALVDKLGIDPGSSLRGLRQRILTTTRS